MTPAVCLALALFFEARSEPVVAQEAIAGVILNRVADSRYPDDVCEVVFEPKQFSWTHDGLSDDPDDYTNHGDRQAWSQLQEAAEELLVEEPYVSSTHYHTISVSPGWAQHYEFDGRHGAHLFFTNSTPWR